MYIVVILGMAKSPLLCLCHRVRWQGQRTTDPIGQGAVGAAVARSWLPS